MSSVLHMETEVVRAVAQQLNALAETLASRSESLSGALYGLKWQSPSRDTFVVDFDHNMRTIKSLSAAATTLSLRMQHEADEWELADNNGVNSFIDFGKTLLPIISGVDLFLASQTGQVLGVSLASSPAELKSQYQQMRWADKFAEQGQLGQDIHALEEQFPGTTLENIDEQIAKLEAEKTALGEKASNFWNKILPDTPLERDTEDGLPWRVKADDYEDEIIRCDQQIKDLNELKDLYTRRDVLNEVITQGIPKDGPTVTWLRDDLGGCTHYVAGKRNVQPWPNSSGQPGHPGDAHLWNDQASQAGYEVGNVPVKGAIMVWEKGASADGYIGDAERGHVAFVTGVQPNSDGSFDVSFTDNGNQSTPVIKTVRPGDAGISFIYDK